MAPLKLAKVLYDENLEYNYKTKDPEPSNFTQMVWKSSEFIGFGMQKSLNGKYYYVINYYPTGNIDGQFQKNVFPVGTIAPEPINKKINLISKESNNNIKVNNNKKETSIKKEYRKKDSMKKDYIKRDSIKKDYIKRDSIKKDYIKRDTIKKDYIKRDTIKKDYKKKDSIKIDNKKTGSIKKDYKKRDTFSPDNDYPTTQNNKTTININSKKFGLKDSNKDNIEYEIQYNEISNNNNENKMTNRTLDILKQLINSKKNEIVNKNKSPNKQNSQYKRKYTKKITMKKENYEPSPQINNTNSAFNEFCQEALDAHNKYRKIHHVEPLILNKEICKIAESYAKHLANLGHLEHSDNCYKEDTLGENLYCCFGHKASGEEVSKNWYDENKKYNYNGDWKSGTGHFTQMVWKGTKEVGFGKFKDKRGRIYVVGNYHPAGNVIGFFKYNVFKP